MNLVRSRRLAVLGAVLLASCARGPRPAPGAPSASAVPTPAQVLGFVPGDDRKLPTWAQVAGYFARLDAASPRVEVHTLGRTTLGRPFLAAFVGDSATIADLPRYREIQRRLADPRLWPRDEAARARVRDSLVAAGKVVVLVTSSIHSDEVGGILAPLVLAHRLATADDAEARAIRANAVVIIVPSLNPDGVDLVGDWYRATLGTRYEGADVPFLYHAYTGHDNNRDWYAFTQVETRLTVDSLHNVWHPQVVNDIHQQGPYGSRIFIPPYLPPVEPNVDPLVIESVDSLGSRVARRLLAEGRTGVVTHALYDAWTPARAYQHYHGGARILTETASARLASPVALTLDSLRAGRGYDPRLVSPNFPTLWRGGRWSLGDIVDYQASAAWDIVATTAAARAEWLDRFARVGERAVAGRAAPGRGDWPVALVVPQQQPDQAPLRTMLRALQRGGVEVRRALYPFQSGNARYSGGAYVILAEQPYFAFAKALLESQRYPDLRDSSGAPVRPYDVTAHTLPLLMGVRVGVVRDSFPVPTTEPIPMVDEPRLVAPGLTRGAGDATATSSPRRIAVYRSYAATEDEGWTRWVLEQYGIPFTSVTDRDVRAGLAGRFDALILPDQPPREIAVGLSRAEYPDSLAGGLGDFGAASLRAFVDGGGTVVALNRASRYAIDALALPVRDALAGLPPRDFYAPGSILELRLDRAHPMTRDVTAPAVAWFEGGPAFEVAPGADPSRVHVVASYPTDGDPLLSGWLLGGERLRGRGALVEVRQGRGRVVLFGFRPQYRGQSMATYPLLWGALR